MQTVSTSQLISELENLLNASPDGVLAFDGDGTLWSGDVGEDFFFAFSGHGDYRPLAASKLEEELRALQVPVSHDGATNAKALFLAYEQGRYPEDRTCEMIAWSVAGWDPRELEAFALRTLNEVELAERVHPETRAMVQWAKNRAVPIFVVSASPRCIVGPAAEMVGIASSHVVAVTPLSDGARFLADVERPIPYAAGKVSQLKRRIGERPLLAAFGDNVFDLEMLGAATLPIAVHPKKRLLEQSHTLASLRTLEL